jgi:multiple sugar transport system substrate-binding protein
MSKHHLSRPWYKVAPACALVLMAFLAACGNNSNSNGPVTLTVGWWSNGPAKDTGFGQWFQSFTATHPNVKIKTEFLDWNSYWNKVTTTTAGGNAYDLVGLCSCLAAQYYAKNVFVDLSTQPGYQSVAQELLPKDLQLTQWSGHTYSIPLGIATFGIGYNKTMFQAAGLPNPDPSTPMSWDQFLNTFKVLSKFDSKGNATQYALMPINVLDFEEFVLMAGGTLYDNQINPTKITVNTPEGIAGLAAYQSMFTNKLVPPYNSLGSSEWGGGDIASLETNRVAMARVGDWNIDEINSKNLNYGIMPVPTIQKSVMLSGANSLGIYRGSKHISEAWQFLQWAASQDGDTGFAKVSDPPANAAAAANLSSIISNADYVKTFNYGLNNQVPQEETTHTDLSTTLTNIVNDLANGKITPAQAAAQMEQKGNAILSSGT